MKKHTEIELPIDEAVERTILSSCMQSQNCADVCSEALIEKDFYTTKHKIVFKAIKSIADKNLCPDLLSVIDWVKTSGLQKFCSEVDIAEIYGVASVTEATIANHIEICKEKSILRSVIQTAQNAIVAATSLKPSGDVIGGLDRGIVECTERNEIGGFKSIAETMEETIAIANKKASGQIKGIPTGVQELDKLLCGIQEEDSIVLGGRTSQGKTALALTMILNAAKAGARCAIFSLEMSRNQLNQRLLCMESRQNLHGLMKGYLKREERDQIDSVRNLVGSLPIFVDDSTGVNSDYIKYKLRSLIHKHGVDFCVVDYIGLMGKKEREDTDIRIRISNASDELTKMVKTFKIPILYLSQMARPPRTGLKVASHRPTLNDLKESGQIENNAVIALLVHREEVYSDTEKHPDLIGSAEIIVAKQRNGPTGTAHCFFDKKCALFHDGDPNA